MRRFLYIALLLVAAPMIASAQVAKQVEVEKDYIPSVNKAQKLAMVPDMTDTVMMRPDIDYSFMPRSYETSLLTENFKPATISYWDFVRKRLLYVKAAAGVPLASEADVYVSTYNKDRGYAMAYLNHEGDYQNRWALDGVTKVKDNTSEMSNRLGGRAGLNVGRHLLEVDIYGDQQMRHRYPTTGELIRFGEVQGALRFGDDFVDLSRWNFSVEVDGGFYYNRARSASDEKFNQSQFSVKAAVGRMLGQHQLKIHAGYMGVYGGGALEAYKNNILMAGARYGVSGNRFNFLIGADYYHDRVGESGNSPHHIFPYVRMMWNNSKQSFVPYVEVDGELKQHNFGTLSYENPFILASQSVVDDGSVFSLANETLYNGRAGISGNLGKGIFSYNLSAQFTIADNHLYWYNVGADYLFTTAYQHSFTANGNIVFRPAGWFEAALDVSAYIWENYDDYYNSRPNFELDLGLRYTGRRLTVGANLGYMGGIKWMTLAEVVGEGGFPSFEATKTDSTFTLGLDAEWRINDNWAVFAEGRNLTGSKVYEWLHYYRDSAQGIVGVKFNF